MRRMRKPAPMATDRLTLRVKQISVESPSLEHDGGVSPPGLGGGDVLV